MHDSIGLESEGIPTAAVATSAFTDAAALQAEHLGLPEYDTVIVPHPVQNATAEEVTAHADAAMDAIVHRLLVGHGGN